MGWSSEDDRWWREGNLEEMGEKATQDAHSLKCAPGRGKGKQKDASGSLILPTIAQTGRFDEQMHGQWPNIEWSETLTVAGTHKTMSERDPAH